MAALAAVTIDGPVASGKTTVAMRVAAELGYLYLDTGSMYRALALSALRSAADVDNENALLRLLESVPIRAVLDPKRPPAFRIFLAADEIGAQLFSKEVTAVVSTVAAHERVREHMVHEQRRIARVGRVVMAGRDIGTVVLPEAKVKIFLTASVAVRVARRAAELERAGASVERERLFAEIEERDRLDASRAISPLRPAEGAHVVDSTNLDVGEVTAKIVALARGSSA